MSWWDKKYFEASPAEPLTWDRLFYGANNPTTFQKRFCYISFGLSIFAIYSLFVNFIPNDSWLNKALYLSIFLGVASAIFIFWALITNRIKPYSPLPHIILKIAVSIGFGIGGFFVFYQSSTYGVADLYTRFLGNPYTTTAPLEKHFDSFSPYSCNYTVRGYILINSSREYLCITSSEYQKISDLQQFTITGLSSYAGIHIANYYPATSH